MIVVPFLITFSRFSIVFHHFFDGLAFLIGWLFHSPPFLLLVLFGLVLVVWLLQTFLITVFLQCIGRWVALGCVFSLFGHVNIFWYSLVICFGLRRLFTLSLFFQSFDHFGFIFFFILVVLVILFVWLFLSFLIGHFWTFFDQLLFRFPSHSAFFWSTDVLKLFDRYGLLCSCKVF